MVLNMRPNKDGICFQTCDSDWFFLTKLKLLQVLLLSSLMNCRIILELFFNVLVGKKDQCSQHIETSQLISELAS